MRSTIWPPGTRVPSSPSTAERSRKTSWRASSLDMREARLQEPTRRVQDASTLPGGARSFDVQVHLAGVLTRKPSTNKPLPGLDSGFNNRLILRLLDLHQKHLKSQSKKLHIDKIIDEAKAIDLKNHDLKNKLDTAKKEHIKTLPTRPPKDGGITASILSNN